MVPSLLLLSCESSVFAKENPCRKKGLYKTTCYKTKSNFSKFFFSHWLLHKCFFSFLIKAFANFEKFGRFHWQAFIVNKNGENLKMLIEIFFQKLVVSNVILALLDHLTPDIFSSANHGGPHRVLSLFKTSRSRPWSMWSNAEISFSVCLLASRCWVMFSVQTADTKASIVYTSFDLVQVVLRTAVISSMYSFIFLTFP